MTESEAAEARARLWGRLPSAPALLGLTVLLYLAAIPAYNDDIRYFLRPWYDYLIEHGRFAALGEPFANYAPPYLYLLSIGTLADGLLSPLIVIKLVAIFSVVLLCLGMYRLLTVFRPPEQARLPAIALPLLPTVFINAPLWGQCDTLYAAGVLLALGELLRGRWATGMAALGVAFSIKAQTIFIAPVIFYLLLSRRIPLLSLLIPAAVYALMMSPAWLAGRSAWDLATIYVMQGGFYRDLSKAAPNMWEYVDGLGLVTYEAGVVIGLTLGVAATLGLAFFAWRHRFTGERLLLLALSSTILLPYVMPKMHNRYFFLADVLSFALAVVRPSPRLIRIAILIQIGSALAGLRFLYKIPAGAPIGGIFMTWALVLVVKELRDSGAASLADRAS